MQFPLKIPASAFDAQISALKSIFYDKEKFTFSLAQLYLYFSIGITVLAVLISVLFVVAEYEGYQKERKQYIKAHAQKINTELFEKLSITENILHLMGGKLRDSNDFSKENVAFLIKHERNDIKQDLFTWTLIDFTNSEKMLIVDSINGIRKNPIYLNDSREWLITAKQEPWKMKFSPPSVGFITKRPIIPTGYGITDNKGVFRGYLSAAIYIEKITNFINKIIEPDVIYFITDENYNYITSSDKTLGDNSVHIINQFKENRKFSKLKSFKVKVGDRDIEFTRYIKVHDYPFLVVIGQDANLYTEKFRQDVIPHLLRNLLFSFLFLGVLWFLSHLIVRPVIELDKIAGKISKGDIADIPKYNCMEFNILAQQLSVIQEIAKNLRYKQAQLTKTNNSLQAANEFIQSNMSFLSHEFKNPTHTIIGFSEILLEKLQTCNDNETIDFAKCIHDIAIHQDKQINFFLKLFEFQDKGKKIESKQFSLKETIRNNIVMVRHHLKKKQVQIRLEIQEDLPDMVGDEIMVGQMIQNFVSNAAKYNKNKGNITVKAFIRVNRNKSEIVLQFRDTGIGIDHRDLNRLFKKFERIKNEKNKDIIGYGLGLAFAKSCVLAHDGDVEIKSEPNVGTTFTVTFPRSRIMRENGNI